MGGAVKVLMLPKKLIVADTSENGDDSELWKTSHRHGSVHNIQQSSIHSSFWVLKASTHRAGFRELTTILTDRPQLLLMALLPQTSQLRSVSIGIAAHTVPLKFAPQTFNGPNTIKHSTTSLVCVHY